MCPVPARERARGEVLHGVRRAHDARRRFAPRRLPRRLHARPPRQQDPQRARAADRRAQTGHRPLRRSQGLARAARRPRSRGRARAARHRARADDGGGAPLRGDRQPGDGRRHHGAVRSAPRPRGPRGARLLRGAAHAQGDGPRRRGRPPPARRRRADPRRAQLRRGRRPLDRQRSPDGLQRGRPDHAPGRAHGAARPSRHHPHHRRHLPARRALHRGRLAGPDADQGPQGPGGGLGAQARHARDLEPRRHRRPRADRDARPRRRDGHAGAPARARARDAGRSSR